MSGTITRCCAGMAVSVLLFLTACKSYDDAKENWPDTPDRGTIHVSADETFKPVVDQLVNVYESNHPGTTIIVTYKPEADCLKDMLVDSVRMIIATRRFSKAEEILINDSFHVMPKSQVVARDGISVIGHPSLSDSLFTMEDIKQVLTGSFVKNLIPVFDGVKATSTVRFIIDSVLKGESLTPNAMAARTSEGVIEFVAKNPQAIGFIGVGWIGNREDTTQLSFLKRVKVVSLEATDSPDSYVKAYQANIYVKRYPMVRDLVYILKESHRGLGTGFADFMSGNIGQLIFRRAYLAPALKRLGIRKVQLKE